MTAEAETIDNTVDWINYAQGKHVFGVIRSKN